MLDKASQVFGILFAALLVLAAGCRSRTGSDREIDVSSLLGRMTDVASFAQSPIGSAPMISTYDRTGGNQDWGKFGHVEDGTEITLSELTGPGCVTRIWQTSVAGREVRFYVDGESEPRLTAPWMALFGREPRQAPFFPPLCDVVSGGSYCYFPLPYEKSLRIALLVPEMKPGATPYYHINYRSYPSGTRVASLPAAFSRQGISALGDLQDVWQKTGDSLRDIVKACHPAVHPLGPGQTVTWLNHEGAGNLAGFVIRPSLHEPHDHPISRVRLLRNLSLRLYWDGSAEPSVDVPLGDFFCNGLYPRAFSAMPLGFVDGAYVCRFPMPFQHGVRAELRNGGDFPLNLEVGCLLDTVPPAPDARFFHAQWGHSVSRGVPFSVLNANGPGHYVGCYLISLGMDGSWTILEGDERIFVDGETQASLHGTGLEDYFNGAWYYTGLFDLPLHGLLEKEGPRTAQYRFHLLDAVPFGKSFSMNFEFGDRNRARGYMSAVAYWYQDSPSPAGTHWPPPAQRHVPVDRLGIAATMCGLMELERIGHVEEAAARCDYLAFLLGNQPEAGMYRLRAAAYREMQEGFPSVKQDYAKLAARWRGTPVAAQASQLQWFHESPSNALLSAHVNGDYKLYVDGKLVLQGNDVTMLHSAPLAVAPGRHVLAADVKWNRPDNWFNVRLRTHGANVWSDLSWKSLQHPAPAGWADLGFDDSGWNSCIKRYLLPKIQWYEFQPNAFVMTQQGDLIGPIRGGNAVGKRSYFRKVFEVR